MKTYLVLREKKSNKIEHSDATHDDTLMAYLIVRYALYYGQYLKKHGISAIPSAANANSRMREDELKMLENIISRANTEVETRAAESESYNFIAEQTRKMKGGNPEDSVNTEFMNMFLNFFD
jgi:hypothetical protein